MRTFRRRPEIEQKAFGAMLGAIFRARPDERAKKSSARGQRSFS
jgi:hypothetical protein